LVLAGGHRDSGKFWEGKKGAQRIYVVNGKEGTGMDENLMEGGRGGLRRKRKGKGMIRSKDETKKREGG
jgi:hypothetical protein